MNYPPYYQQNPQQNFNPQQPVFNCRPVTSREEALATQIDYFNAGTILPDLSHNAIYLKRFNQQTGASDFLVFAYTVPKEPETPHYATVEMLEELEKRLTGGKNE